MVRQSPVLRCSICCSSPGSLLPFWGSPPKCYVRNGQLVYGIIQGSRLTPFPPTQTVEQLNEVLNYVANHFAVFTMLVVLWMLVSGAIYSWRWLGDRRVVGSGRTAVTIIAAPLLAILAFFLISNVNVDLVRADIIYKQGQQFDNAGQWINSIELYGRALSERTTEDQYMLFLGRSLLEQAKTVQVPEGASRFPEGGTLAQVLALRPNDVAQMGRVDLLRAAEAVLLQAQRVNPLNTDHTANLARLYRTWADLSVDNPQMRQEMLNKSLAMYDVATTLSPNAAHLWNEKGNAYQARAENDKAEATYLHKRASMHLKRQTECHPLLNCGAIWVLPMLAKTRLTQRLRQTSK